MAFGIEWLKPEIDKFAYWVHIAILMTVIILFVTFVGPYITIGSAAVNMSIATAIGLVLGDIIAHTILQLD